MKKPLTILLLSTLAIAGAPAARAEFLLTSAIVEFTGDGPRQQDIEIVSRSKESDYVVSEVSEITHPGLADEKRVLIDDPAQSSLLVTPDKTILGGGNRKTLRFVLLKESDDAEHIYRVAVKPVIRGVDNNSKVGLKLLIGYEVLVIIRPAAMHPSYSVVRHGKEIVVANNGNVDILFQNGKQCTTPDACVKTPVMRAYPGQTDHITLPLDQAVSYSVWDGKTVVEKKF